MYPPPRIFLVYFVFCMFIRISVSFVVSNWFFNDLFSPFFYSLSMNIRFSLQFLTYSPICIVLSAQYYTLFICHSAYFSSNSLCFLSIISSILAIYCPTSLTFSHLSMRCVPSGFGTGQTRLVLAPAPQATIVCFSSKTTPYRVLPYITQYYRFKLIIANPYTVHFIRFDVKLSRCSGY